MQNEQKIYQIYFCVRLAKNYGFPYQRERKGMDGEAHTCHLRMRSVARCCRRCFGDWCRLPVAAATTSSPVELGTAWGCVHGSIGGHTLHLTHETCKTRWDLWIARLSAVLLIKTSLLIEHSVQIYIHSVYIRIHRSYCIHFSWHRAGVGNTAKNTVLICTKASPCPQNPLVSSRSTNVICLLQH